MAQLNKLNIIALTLLITGAIDSIRNLPASALFGPTIIFFFIFSAIVFLIPTALISAELAANVNEGGIYQWGRLAFGEKIGFLAVWFQWVNNIIWFPTILSFIAGTAAYLIAPDLAQNKTFLISAILGQFWFLTILNLYGIRLSSIFTSICAITGLIIPMATIIILMFIWLALGMPLQIHLTAATMIPNFSYSDNWLALTAIIAGFLGMELAAVHIKDVNNPRQTYPKALGIATTIILTTMTLGSLAIAFVIPYSQINLVNGTIETFSYFLSAYHIAWVLPILTVLLVVGSLGGVISWVISPIKGISQAANDGYLPPTFRKLNHYGVAQNLLLTQAVLVSFVCVAFLLIPSVNGSYWLLTALSTQLYMFMYVIMFLCAIALRLKTNYEKGTFTIPGGKWGTIIVGMLGLIGCAITIFVGFIPPANFNIGGNWYYETIFCAGLLIMTLPILFFYWYKHRKITTEFVPIEEQTS